MDLTLFEIISTYGNSRAIMIMDKIQDHIDRGIMRYDQGNDLLSKLAMQLLRNDPVLLAKYSLELGLS